MSHPCEWFARQGALVLAARSTLTPAALKQKLIATVDLMYTRINPVTNTLNIEAQAIDPQTVEPQM